MTQRLPIPGQDSGDWGDILNGFLEVSLASDGTLNSGVVGTAQIANNAVTNAQLDVPTQTTLATVPSKYTKPGSGIPATDLTTAVQTNLTSASTAVQSSTNLSGDLSGTIASPVVAKISGVAMPSGAPNTGQVIQATSASATNWATVTSTTVSDATSSTKGIIQLDGDLSGTAASPTVTTIGGNTPVTTVTTLTGGDLTGTLPSPTVAKVNGVAVTGTPSSGQVITASSGTAAAWTTPVAGFTDPTTTKGDIIVHGSTTTREPIGTDGQILTADSTQSTGIKWAAASAASNATTSTPGLIELAGDLGGTATAPTVAKVNGITLPSSAPAVGNVLTATSASATSWTTPAAGVMLDSTVSDIQTDTVTGTAVAGTTGKAADAGHQHPLVSHAHTTANTGGQLNPTTSLSSTGTPSSTTFLRGDNSWSSVPAASNATSSTPGLIELSGDLSGTATAPTVAKINGGIVLPGTAPSASGQVLTTTSTGSSATTSWTTPAAGVILDSTAADIQMNGTQTAGSVGKAADAGHIHPTDTSRAPLASPTFTGTPAAPTATAGDSTTKLATTAFVSSAVTAGSSSSAQVLTPTAVKTSAYTASPGDFVPVDASSGSVTITLPTAPADKSRVEIKMIKTAGVYTVTFNTGGSDVLNASGSSTSGILFVLNQAIMLQYSASPGIWYVQSDDLPQASVVMGYTHTVTTAYTLISTDHNVLADATSAAFTITLPTAVGFTGRYTIEAITTTNNVVTVATTSSQTIEGSSTITLGTTASGAYYGSVDLISDGANWRVV